MRPKNETETESSVELYIKGAHGNWSYPVYEGQNFLSFYKLNNITFMIKVISTTETLPDYEQLLIF